MLDTYGEIAIEPLSSVDLADGRLVFYRLGESGRMEHVATERAVGISETRGA